jgi:hypothetical protein
VVATFGERLAVNKKMQFSNGKVRSKESNEAEVKEKHYVVIPNGFTASEDLD